MQRLPIDIGIIHFIGIGGIGMSGIAEILHNLGYKVQGSDISENQNVKRLQEMGVKVFVGQASKNLSAVSIAVVSTAIQAGNVELSFAREKQIPIVHRSEMLAELMRLKWSIACAGTHGKTTTTSLVASVLDSAGLDPTIINGGILNSYGTNARLGDGDWMVVEADESDGSFNNLPATIAVVTNIDPEHLDFHGNFENLKNAFRSFVKNIPEDGLIVMLDIGSVSSSLIVYGKNQQFFTRDLPVGSHHFVKELSDKKEIGYIEAQDLLYRNGISASKESETAGEGVGIAERTVYDSLVEDMRRSLRFYAKQTGQSFFLKIFLTGGAACTPGLAQIVNEKLNIDCAVFNPFETMAGAEELSISNPSQYTTALGLGIRGGMTSG